MHPLLCQHQEWTDGSPTPPGAAPVMKFTGPDMRLMARHVKAALHGRQLSFFFMKREKGTPKWCPPPPDVIKAMTKDTDHVLEGYNSQEAYTTLVPKRRKPSRIALNSINGRGMTLKDDLVPMDLVGPKCDKNSLPLSFATEYSATERPPERLLRCRHETAEARRLPNRLC